MSCSLQSSLGDECQRLFFLSPCLLQVTRIPFNLCTKNSAIIANDKYYILISDTEEMEFSYTSILSVFQIN